MKGSFVKELGVILSIGFILTVIISLFSLDENIAISIYNPQNQLSWWLREYSQIPAIAISILAIIFIIIPQLRLKFKTIRYAAILWLFTLTFGAGALVHLAGKEISDRPRPHETTLLGGTQNFQPPFALPNANFEGKSFPSGHTAMGAIFLVPFFAFRRKNKKVALTFLGAGIAATAIIGYSRMVLGAHFLTDVIWSFIFVYITALIGSKLIPHNADIKSKYFIPAFLTVALLVILFNKFTLTLNIEPKNKTFSISKLPCKEIMLKKGNHQNIQIIINAYGTPKNNITLEEKDGEIKLSKVGIFHSLSCKLIITENNL